MMESLLNYGNSYLKPPKAIATKLTKRYLHTKDEIHISTKPFRDFQFDHLQTIITFDFYQNIPTKNWLRGIYIPIKIQ